VRVRQLLIAAACLALPFFWGDSAHSASDSQQYQVNVPTRLFITAPTIDPVRAYVIGLLDLFFPQDVVFAPQTWRARTNSYQGATVTLETLTAFRHRTAPTSKRDARLEVAVDRTFGPGVWTVNTASDRTRYALGDEVARVQLTAAGPGEVNILLTVTFITVQVFTLQEGYYDTTVVGTITEN
jgi:hypothetical protein